eukprot:GHVL01022005.1.p1 GENE.GHVL01022005.1~~GHVL01022005.1.p1  ORF type:complete len:518 (+),score=81.54 GHVL01022005.1:50-1603(+)
MEEDEEELYDDDGEDLYEDSLVDFDPNAPLASEYKKAYTILRPAEIEETQLRQVEDVVEVLGVTKGEAYALLRVCGWDKSRLQERWFDDEERCRRAAGIQTSADSQMTSESAHDVTRCTVCYDDCSVHDMYGLNCGHKFCLSCWTKYLHSQVDEGKIALLSRCLQHKCSQIVLMEVYEMFCDATHLEKYKLWMTRSYVDDNACAKWCSNPYNCDFAVLYSGSGPVRVECTCGFNFCFLCQKETHRPASCTTVEKWNAKNSAESENLKWIKANTKKCPTCHKNIEKNQGCNHMTCTANAGGCGHEFCWLCLGSWKTHGGSTGGYYQCNIFEKKQKDGIMDEEESSRQEAKNQLDKYIFYYERFFGHQKALTHIQSNRDSIDGKVQQFHDEQNHSVAELQFLYDACDQIKESRQVLKWSYAHGFYLLDGPEKDLFEFNQKNLEEQTELLHGKIEEGSMTILQAETPSDNCERENSPFFVFRTEVTNFSNVTRKFLEQFLNAVENGLTNIEAMMVDKTAS